MPDHPKKKTPSALEKDEDIYALEKAALGKADTKQSSLACKLLSLWAHGLLSATMIREIASCALDDGAQHEELVHLAELAAGASNLETSTEASSGGSVRMLAWKSQSLSVSPALTTRPPWKR